MPDFVKQSEAHSQELLQHFLKHQGINPTQSPRELLSQITTSFACLPYENLSKIVRDDQTSNFEEARRLPKEVLQDFYQLGAGGTCYSLTWTLLQLIRALDYQAEPILADRRYGPNTHTALIVWINGIRHLIDPGYLLVEPIPIPRDVIIHIPTSFNEVELIPDKTHNRMELKTLQHSQSTYRLTYKTDPVDTHQFLAAWDQSFQFDMMKYPVLSKIIDDKQMYLQKNHLLIRTKGESQRQEIEPGKMPETITTIFGIHPSLVVDALNLLHRKEA
ncbi:MAG: arylamine N-acetyltransferase [Planctomycetia bacterium]|nr:arylamine N-acetyltransferase [Planctomycetia bacterium]